jgi:TetR/AcrR family transcriptional regulator, transcriptional repressor for nem operon
MHRRIRAEADWLAALETTGSDPAAELIDAYLSVAHRDDPGHGCPIAALAGDVAQTDPASVIRATFVAGVHEFADTLAAWRQAHRSEGAASCRDAALVELATLVGAITLARATQGDEISRAVLAATRDALQAA